MYVVFVHNRDRFDPGKSNRWVSKRGGLSSCDIKEFGIEHSIICLSQTDDLGAKKAALIEPAVRLPANNQQSQYCDWVSKQEAQYEAEADCAIDANGTMVAAGR